MLSPFSKLRTAWASVMQAGPNVCGGWFELLGRWFVTSLSDTQGLALDLVHHIEHQLRLHQPFFAILPVPGVK